MDPSAINQRIRVMHEDLGMTPEQISEDGGIELVLVKSVLASIDPVFAKTIEEDISDGEYKQFLSTYKNLALGTDNPNVQERSLRWLMEEKKGRNEARIKSLQEMGKVNVLLLQQAFEQAKFAEQRALGNCKPIIELQQEIKDKEKQLERISDAAAVVGAGIAYIASNI